VTHPHSSQHISQGAVTPDYQLDREQSIRILNEALATELVCTLRYQFHYFMATGIHSQSVKEEFREHAREEQQHAERIAVESYREMIRYFGERDPTSRVMLEDILAKEEEHADELTDLLFAVEPSTGEGSRKLYFADEVPTAKEAGEARHEGSSGRGGGSAGGSKKPS
jgi:bacterioferritin (cytochrome b1)